MQLKRINRDKLINAKVNTETWQGFLEICQDFGISASLAIADYVAYIGQKTESTQIFQKFQDNNLTDDRSNRDKSVTAYVTTSNWQNFLESCQNFGISANLAIAQYVAFIAKDGKNMLKVLQNHRLNANTASISWDGKSQLEINQELLQKIKELENRIEFLEKRW